MTPTLEKPSPTLPLLQRILALRSLSTHFQPIVSVKRKALIGVEALARAWDPRSGAPVAPPQLFGMARDEGKLLEMDQCCQEQALRSFTDLPRRDPELLLFMNIEASLVDEHPGLSLLEAAREAGVAPSNIVIEVNETQVLDQRLLADFVERHRQLGFLIAMDDLGSGHSSLQRWPLLKPDIIKLDRGIVDGVAGNFFAQELLRSLIALGRQTGALILAEGVETQADVQACLDLGVDLFQGFYFARPAALGSPNLDEALQKALECAGSQKERSLEQMGRRRAEFQVHSDEARALAHGLSAGPVGAFSEVLSALPFSSAVESLCLLDERGLQATPVIFPNGQRHNARASLFQASKPGTDHSDRDYFYGLTESGRGRDFFLTDTHRSPASGLLCRTLSHVFQHPSGVSFIACLDLRAA